MLLIYVDRITNRLGYTLNFIFRDILGIEYHITNKKEDFIAFEGPKLSYSKKKISDEVFIYSKDLLFETVIEDKNIEAFYFDGIPAFFRTYSSKSSIPFDIFAASFYLVSRYEEYLPYMQDEHGRFRHEDSIAYKNNFLDIPIVNIWAKKLDKMINEHYPSFEIKQRYFRYFNTIDIDSAYSFSEKSVIRKLYGFFRDLLRGDFSECLFRINVLMKKEMDPYDTFNYQISLINKFKLKTIYFVLFGSFGKYDKNISPYNRRFQRLIKFLCDYAKVGIHPSYDSFDDPKQLTKQLRDIIEVIHKPVFRSRFHFLRFRLPVSFRTLIENKITDDYSMGYSNIIGFRAGICTEFNFYDLEFDVETNLRLHPFAIMDVALKKGMKLNADEAMQAIKSIVDNIADVNGDFISIWHNETLCERYEWNGWRDVYETMLEYVSKLDRAPYTEINKSV
ncbi:MAG: uncharacterized protein H6Q15_726 [Bacteroidetes bacterium]|nr:uncharacterized protein [Bacteroidota bacterium]